MTGRNWRDSVIAYIRAETAPADKFGHMPRLYALATRITKDQLVKDPTAKERDCDDDVLIRSRLDA